MDHDELEAKVARGIAWLTEHDPTGIYHFWFRAGLTAGSPMPRLTPEQREDWIRYWKQRTLWERMDADCRRLDSEAYGATGELVPGMTRKYSEAEVRKALGVMDLPMIVFKPQDMPGPYQDKKPADFLVWTPRGQMVEVKETSAKGVFGLGQAFRPAQIATMRRCQELGVPYLVVVRWSSLRRWTITTGPRVLHRWDNLAKAYSRADMPIDCPPGDLASHLRMALLGEID